MHGPLGVGPKKHGNYRNVPNNFEVKSNEKKTAERFCSSDFETDER